MLKSGEADVVQLPIANIPEVKNDPRFKVVWAKFVYASSLIFCDLAFPNDPSPFHDIRVRRAVSYAINRKAICDNVLHGSAEIWGDILAPYHPGANPDIKLPYDPEKAKALLKEAGYPNGFDTALNFGFLGDRLQAQAVAADLAKVGIRAKLVEFEQANYIRNYFEKKYRGLTRHTNPWWGGRTNPGVAIEVGISSKNAWTYFTTPKTEAAWQKLAALTNEKEIAAQAKEVSRLWHESEVRCMLWAMHQPFGLSSRVKSYTPIRGWSLISGLEYLELSD
jgi:peptide/nickel transport system substrate-binding protein